MKFIFFVSLIVTLLCAENPKAYSTLGDVIFNNAEKIAKLKSIIFYGRYKQKLENYQKKIIKIKAMGLRLDRTNNSYTQKKYLKNLRELIVVNDFFMNLVHNDFISSIEKKDSTLFACLINSGMIDSNKYHKEIINFYNENMKHTSVKGLLQEIVEKQKELDSFVIQKKIKKPILKRETQKEKIQRLKEKDRLEQIELEKSLENERVKTKEYLLNLKDMKNTKKY